MILVKSICSCCGKIYPDECNGKIYKQKWRSSPFRTCLGRDELYHGPDGRVYVIVVVGHGHTEHLDLEETDE